VRHAKLLVVLSVYGVNRGRRLKVKGVSGPFPHFAWMPLTP
jgi:hypothetical protein